MFKENFGPSKVLEEIIVEDEIEEILSLLPVFMTSPPDREREIFYFSSLKKDFPQIDILPTLKDFLAWILDNPDRYDKAKPAFHRRFRKWCERASNPRAW